jgi:hypothetical protein
MEVRNLEAAQMLGAELKIAVNEATEKLMNETNAVVVDGLTPINAKGSGAAIS